MSAAPGSRDLRLLAAGQGVSAAGDFAAGIALTLRLQSHGAIWLSALLLAELLPAVVLAPFVGRLADRFESRALLTIALAAQAVVAVPLALLVSPVLTITLFMALNAVKAVGRPASAALVPIILGPRRSGAGYAQLSSATSLGQIAGPALGGLLASTVGTTATVLIDAVSFAVLAAAVSRLRARRPPVATVAGVVPYRGAGYALLFRPRPLRIALVVLLVTLVCAVLANVATPYRYLDGLRVGPIGYGVAETSWAVGTLFGAQVAGRVGVARQLQSLVLAGVVLGIAIAAIGLIPVLLPVLAVSVLGGAANGVINVLPNAMVAAYVPTEMHGRAFAASNGLIQSAWCVAALAGAPLVAGVGPTSALVLAGASAAGGTVLAALVAGRGQRAISA